MQAFFTKHIPEEGQVFLAVHMWPQLGWQSRQQLIQTYKTEIKHRASPHSVASLISLEVCETDSRSVSLLPGLYSGPSSKTLLQRRGAFGFLNSKDGCINRPVFTLCGGHFTVLQVYITRDRKCVQAFKEKKKKMHTFLSLIVITFPSMLAKK